MQLRNKKQKNVEDLEYKNTFSYSSLSLSLILGNIICICKLNAFDETQP
jgi:hypothetical protein